MKRKEMKRRKLKIEKAVLKFAGIIFLSLLLFAIGNKTAEAAEIISANATGQTAVSWMVSNLGHTYYFIKREKISTGVQDVIWSIDNRSLSAPTSYSGTDTGLTCNTGYVYHLYHGDGLFVADHLAQTGTITTSACNAPPIASNVTASGNEGNTILITPSITDPEGDAYTVYWFGEGDVDCGVTTGAGPAATRSYTSPGYIVGPKSDPIQITYSYKATDSAGGTSACKTATVTWNNLNPSVTITNNGPVDQGGTIRFTANPSDPPPGSVKSFTYQWHYNSVCADPIGGEISSTYSMTLSSAGTAWRYVKVFDGNGGSACGGSEGVWNAVDITPPTPNPPTVTAGSITANSVNWTLSNVSDSGSGPNATPYGFSSVSGGPYAFQAGATWNEGGLSPNTSYTRYGVLRDAANNQTAQGSASALTLPGTPGTPTFTSITQTSLTVNWTAPTGGAASYKIERAPNASGAPGAWGQIAAGVFATSHSNSGLSCGTTYWYRIRATNASGDSSYSGSASASTSSCTPRSATLSGSPSASGWTNTGTFTYTPACVAQGGTSFTSLTFCTTHVSINGGAYNQISNVQTAGQTYTMTNGNGYIFKTIEADSGGSITSSLVPSSGQIQVDTTFPSAPTVFCKDGTNSYISGQWANLGSPTCTWNDTTGLSPGAFYSCTGQNCSPGGTSNASRSVVTNFPEGTSYFSAQNCDTGGCSSVTQFTVMRDVTPPTITSVTASSPSCGTIRFTVNGAGDALSGLQTSAYSFDGGTNWQAGNSKDVSGTSAALAANSIKVRDKAGNIYAYGSGVSGTATACTPRSATLSGSPSTSGWTNTGTFTYTPACVAQGGTSFTSLTFCTTHVSINGGAYNQISNVQTAGQTYTMTNGNGYIFKTIETDTGGSITSSLVPSSGQIQVDIALPSVSITNPAASSWQSGTFNPTVSNTDAGSGINPESCTYKVESKNGAIWETTVPTVGYVCTNTSISISVGSTENCKYQGVDTCRVTISGQDNALNSSTDNRLFSIDWSAPLTSIADPIAAWQTANFTAAITDASDAQLCWARAYNTSATTFPGYTQRATCPDGGFDVSLTTACTNQGADACTVEAYATDAANNTGATAWRTFSIDKTAPSAPTISCTNYAHDTWSNSTAATTCTITDTATPSSRTAVAYSTDGGTNWTDNTNNLSFPFTPAAGTTNVIMRISDSGGGPTNSNTYTIKVDRTAPTVPTLTCTNYAHDTWSNSTAATTCSITNTGGPSPINVAYSTNNGASWTDIGTNLSFPSFTPVAGTTNVIMRISDTGGGPTNSNAYTIKVDRAAPGAPTLSCTNYAHDTPSNSTAATTCTITDTATPSSRTAVAYSTNNGASWTDIGTNLSTPSFTLAEGTTNVIMRISDTGGGPTNSNTYIIRKDTIIPTATITNPPGGATNWYISTFNVIVNDEIGSDPTVWEARVYNDGASPLPAWTSRLSLDGPVSVNSANCTAEGTNSCRVDVRNKDAAGNVSVPNTRTFSIDRTMPNFSSPSAAPLDGGVNINNPSLVFTANPTDSGGSGISTCYAQIDVNNADGAALAADNINVGADADIGTPGDPNTFAGTSGNTYYYRYYCVDAAGNAPLAGTWSSWTDGIRVDTEAPTTAITAPPEGSWHGIDFSVSFSDGDLGGSGFQSCAYQILDNGTVSAGGTRSCSGSVTVDISVHCRTPGGNTCRVQGSAADNAGNIGNTASRSFSIGGGEFLIID